MNMAKSTVNVARGILDIAKRIGNRLGDILLFIMFLTVMIVSSLTVVAAFWNMRSSTEAVEIRMVEITKQLEEHPVSNNGAVPPELVAVIDRLGSQAAGVIDSSTMSFLFSVFCLALVSAGVYLLSRSQKNVISSEKRAMAAVTFVINSSAASGVDGFISTAYDSSFQILSTKGEPALTSAITYSRECLRQLERHLTEASKRSIGIDPIQHESFLDRIGMTLENLEKDTGLRNRLAEHITSCKASRDILRTDEFISRFERQKTLLLTCREIDPILN